jgi:hypothetical protein
MAAMAVVADITIGAAGIVKAAVADIAMGVAADIAMGAVSSAADPGRLGLSAVRRKGRPAWRSWANQGRATELAACLSLQRSSE